MTYTLKQAIEQAEILGDGSRKEMLTTVQKGELEVLWDEKQGFFVVFQKEKNQQVLTRLMEVNPDVRMVTPYMFLHMDQESLTAIVMHGAVHRLIS